MAHEADLIIREGLVVTVDSRDTILDRCDVAIKAGRIVAIGPELPHAAPQVIDARGKAVLPGFVDVHMHETLLRGFCEDLPLQQWLQEICFPKDRAYLPEHACAAALMSQLEMIRAGITTFIDIFRFPAQGAQIAEASGLRAIFSPQIIETPAGAGETLESATEFVETWHDRVPGRIYAWYGPHAAYSCSPELFREVHERAAHYGVGVHTHVAETQWEVEQFSTRYGMSSVRWLDELGVLGSNVLAAHCVAVSDSDIHILRQRDVAVAHNPTSNAKLASGISPVLKMLEAGVRVGLGTDSNLSNNRLDMFAEMKMAALLQRLESKDASALPCGRALRLATIDGARCLGLESDVGSLEVGKKADVILIDLDQPHLWPLLSGDQGNVVAQLVYAACSGDVATAMVDGKILMQDRRVLTLDQDTAKDLVSSAARDLIARTADSQRQI